MTAPKLWQQSTIFGEKLPMNELDPERPPEGACTERCYDAEEEKCTCRCGGAYHGLGRLNKRTKKNLEKTESNQGEGSS